MLALQFDGRVGVVAVAPIPVPGSDEALIRVGRAGVCNTDLEIAEGYKGFHGTLGHEFVGEVVFAPEPEWVGKRVCGEINIACGSCRFCVDDMRSHCIRRRVLGIMGHPGAFAEYLTLPISNLHEVPGEIDDDEAVFVEPLAAAFEILEQVAVGPESRVIVLGDGKLGLLCAQVLNRSGAQTVLLGKHDNKLVLARRLGLTARLAGEEAGGADIVVDATGSPSGLDEALSLVRPRGTLVLKTTTARPVSIDVSPVVVKEVTIVGSRCGPFTRAMQALMQREIQVTPIIEARYPLRDGVSALRHARGPGALKILIDVVDGAESSL